MCVALVSVNLSSLLCDRISPVMNAFPQIPIIYLIIYSFVLFVLIWADFLIFPTHLLKMQDNHHLLAKDDDLSYTIKKGCSGMYSAHALCILYMVK